MTISRSALLTTALLTAFVATLPAAPIPLNLGGTTSYDGWTNVTAGGGYGGVSFPGTAAWKTSTGNWTSFDPGTGVVGAIGSNTASSDDAALYKIANGPAGGPYPANESIYFGGASAQVNLNGGTLGFGDATPLAGVKTVAFQAEIGEAFGYDFYNHALPVLSYTTASGTAEITASHSDLISQLYSGSVLMPSGLEDIYKNLWGLQFDLSGVTDPILSYQVKFTGVQHAQLYAAQLDQSDAAHAEIVFPQATQWTAAGADTNWSTTANWTGDALPASGTEVSFATGSSVTLDGSRSVSSLDLGAPNDFTIASGEGSLTIGAGGITTSSPGAADHVISAPVTLSGFTLMTVDEGDSLAFTGGLTAPGFYKKGDGNLSLAGATTFTGNTYNQVILMGGTNTVTGTVLNSGGTALEIYLKNTALHLNGGDNRIGSNFALNLYSRRFTNGETVLGEENAFLVLGDVSGKSDQTLNSIKADGVNVFNEATGIGTTGTSSNSAILGGSPLVSTLTIDAQAADSVTAFLGKIGGSDENENNLALVKQGPGVQSLGGSSSYLGGTVVKGGMLRIDAASALSTASNVKLDGGVLGLGWGDYQADLGSAAGEVQFTGSGGFAAFGGDLDENFNVIPRVLTLNGGAGVAWGAGGFVPDGSKLLLSHAKADNDLELTNAIDLGGSTRVIQVDNGSSSIDGRLSGAISGSGGLVKTGGGALELTTVSSYTGGTHVKEGALLLAGFDGSIPGNVEVEAAASFSLTNGGVNNSYYEDRLPDSSRVTLKGSTLEYTNSGLGSGAQYSETFGKLELVEGANIVSTSRNTIISTTPDAFALVIGELERQPGSTVHFSGFGLGADVRNQVFLGTPPALDDNIIGGWATTGTGTTGSAATEFVSYGSFGLTALPAASYTAYTAAANDSTWTTASNIKLNASSNAGFTTTLTGAKAINSLNMLGARSGTAGNLLALGGNTLRVETGGIIVSAGAASRSTKINGGFLTAGTGADTPAELFFTAAGAADVGAVIADNGSGKVTLVKTGVNTLTLNGASSYTGSTLVNQGILTLGAAGSVAASPLVEIKRGATLNVSAISGFTVPATQTLQVQGSVTGSVNVAGTLAAGKAVGATGFANNLTLASGSTFRWLAGEDAENGSAIVRVAGTLEISNASTFEVDGTGTDFSSAFWQSPRSFPVLTATGGFAADYATTAPFTLQGTGAGSAQGTWSLTYAIGTVSLIWTPGGTSLAGIQSWRNTHFGTPDDSGDAADLADADHDGIANIIEYGLGLSPLLGAGSDGPQALPVVGTIAGRLHLSFLIPAPAPADAIYRVQVSNDLIEWKTIAKREAAGDWTWEGTGESRISTLPESSQSRISVGDESLISENPSRMMRLNVGH